MEFVKYKFPLRQAHNTVRTRMEGEFPSQASRGAVIYPSAVGAQKGMEGERNVL